MSKRLATPPPLYAQCACGTVYQVGKDGDRDQCDSCAGNERYPGGLLKGIDYSYHNGRGGVEVVITPDAKPQK